ncbi:MAG: GTPase HflX [Candidatus Cloacimonetes bacterium HGW-Cloacimonetes-2]|jgi:GTP-binding protein HflX|nr:MAG: GTPase HflX [Candidatus Cloacimonetes bacterium HGW-Cloacimonetes-2]
MPNRNEEEYDELIDFDIEDEAWEELESTEQTAFLAHLIRQGETEMETETSLDELERLAETAGIQTLGRYKQKRANPERSTFFGKGFLEDIAQRMLQAKADILIINEELSPIQARNIDKSYGIRVIDRTEVILSIFHDHAKTREAKLQVKLAELEYQLPRLRKLWGHFDKERGSARSRGGSASRGMGEKQIEIDRRLIRSQIRAIKRSIDQVVQHKETQRKQRDNVRKICIVGYTNAGKSTLFNALTDAGVLVQDKLFATLDSTSRQLKLDTGAPVVLSDTVGFISRLPHHLVASFKATLMEVQNADLLLHTVDSGDDRMDYYIDQVNDVLAQIGADKIPQILVLNKADTLEKTFRLFVAKRYPDAIFISAKLQENLDDLLQKAQDMIFHTEIITLHIPYDNTALVAKLHELAKIHVEDYRDDAVYLEITISAEDRHLIKDYIE